MYTDYSAIDKFDCDFVLFIASSCSYQCLDPLYLNNKMVDSRGVVKLGMPSKSIHICASQYTGL